MDRELLWKQYEKHIDLFKFYWEIVVKINTFHFAISGAIFSFYFANRSVSEVQYSLVLPALLSFCWAILFGYGGCANKVTRTDMFKICNLLGLEVTPEFVTLSYVLWVFAVVHAVTCISCVWLVLRHVA